MCHLGHGYFSDPPKLNLINKTKLGFAKVGKELEVLEFCIWENDAQNVIANFIAHLFIFSLFFSRIMFEFWGILAGFFTDDNFMVKSICFKHEERPT